MKRFINFSGFILFLFLVSCGGGGGGVSSSGSTGGSSGPSATATLAEEPWVGAWRLQSIAGTDYSNSGVTVTFGKAGTSPSRLDGIHTVCQTCYSGKAWLILSGNSGSITFTDVEFWSDSTPSTQATEAYVEHTMDWTKASYSNAEVESVFSNLAHRNAQASGKFNTGYDNGDYHATYDITTMLAVAYYHDYLEMILTMVTGNSSLAIAMTDQILVSGGLMDFMLAP
ncbi:MAG: hypothetical protein HY751_03415 [Nitrospinae bacterium]|nr:hypothetical protein [Nitrospinota bacterium]